MGKNCAKVSSTDQGRMKRAVRETEYTVFPYTDRPWPANNLFIYIFFLAETGVLVANCCFSLACDAYYQKRNIRQYRNDRVNLFTIFINLFTLLTLKKHLKGYKKSNFVLTNTCQLQIAVKMAF